MTVSLWVHMAIGLCIFVMNTSIGAAILVIVLSDIGCSMRKAFKSPIYNLSKWIN